MYRVMLLSALLITGIAAAARADVNKFSTDGVYLESAGGGGPFTAKGSFNTRSDKLKVRIKCPKGCPIKGRAKLECAVGEGFYFDCSGRIRRKCEVEGRLYQHGFDGTFTCGERSGVWMFGNP